MARLVRLAWLVSVGIAASCAALRTVEREQTAREALSSLARDYSIQVAFRPEHSAFVPSPAWPVSFGYAAKASDATDPVISAILLLDVEVRKYPVDVLGASGLRVIVLVQDLHLGKERRWGIADYVNEVLYLDVDGRMSVRVPLDGPSVSYEFFEHTFHHEFFHLLKEEITGQIRGGEEGWADLNVDGFCYGRGGEMAQSIANSGLPAHPMPGFINVYSMSAIEEDQAELWACLLMEQELRLALSWRDEILCAKLRKLITFANEISANWMSYEMLQ